MPSEYRTGGGAVVETARKDERIRVTGAETKRVKREALGVPDRAKHQQRVAVPMQRRTPEADTRQRVFRYRCYPTPTQAEQLIKTFGACRWTYNEGLALREKAWREHRVSLGFTESCRALTGWRNAEETRWLQDVSSTVLQQALRHLDAAFGRFFKGTAKHPRRKKKSRSRDSATYVRTGFRWLEDPEQSGTGLIALAKQSGPLRIRWSRPLPSGVRPVKLTVSRDRAGRFFVSVLVEERIAPLPPVFLRDGGAPKAVGLDLGLTALVTLDDGEKVDHPRLLRKYGAKIAKLQRSLHRKKRGSKNREKARQEIARLYALISDVRRDALDQLTTRLVRENQVLVVEDLSIDSLVRSPRGRGRRRDEAVRAGGVGAAPGAGHALDDQGLRDAGRGGGRVVGSEIRRKCVPDRRAVGRDACGVRVRPTGCRPQGGVRSAVGAEAGSAPSGAGSKVSCSCSSSRSPGELFVTQEVLTGHMNAR
ncbi:hypothetical protein SCYAM73S_06527 [Streptomyces cyaneofuscatus]|uniref:RNA-guided endonuclease InsQ/TnpB family protein n=1 Tax=Streptomyces cyaneofuscatus TaxID=66883 RepID=UPI000A6ABA2F|nr:transposase [Streptomyces cyaneofuscatus]